MDIKRVSYRNLIVLLIVPLDFLISWLLTIVGQRNSLTDYLLVIVTHYIFVILVVYLFRDLLANHWQKYRQRLWPNLILAFINAGVIVLILAIVREFGPLAIVTVSDHMPIENLLLVTLTSASALVAPLIEKLCIVMF
ncbi:hypothetical protein H9L19_03500 [Weissella diestrammenae]|uniref:Uncharacterized protein n=1 Tax=Weissella diestrammenae TaxID=1162633 RepID=A0A7G9T758_9LACO|nr:hypothetical protein [Weissella diestrammenae]MCM0582466.1 hypothetical protein [Weissella diestrammenae]QNN75933.1 hypothetical protein H9L19_03500 [Weissella diestrammenae]